MRPQVLIGILCLSLTTPGCALFRQSATELVDEYVETVKTEKELTKKLLGVWPYRSCQLRAALGSRINWLPKEATDSWGKLDEIVGIKELEASGSGPEVPAQPAKQFDPGKLSDCELGTASGHSILLCYEVVRKAVKAIAPEIMELLPALL